MDTLDHLFGSPLRARILKLFLMNPDTQFTALEVSQHTKMRPQQFLAEARRLRKNHVLKSLKVRRFIPPSPSSRAKKVKGILAEVFFANKEFALFPELRNLIVKFAPHTKGQLADKIKRLGNVKLAVLAGVFIDDATSRADLLVVGDGLKKTRMKSFIQWLEAEIGKELKYVAMSSQEYKYRQDMYDRFVRDMLELPHVTVIDRLGVAS